MLSAWYGTQYTNRQRNIRELHRIQLLQRSSTSPFLVRRTQKTSAGGSSGAGVNRPNCPRSAAAAAAGLPTTFVISLLVNHTDIDEIYRRRILSGNFGRRAEDSPTSAQYVILIPVSHVGDVLVGSVYFFVPVESNERFWGGGGQGIISFK